MYPEYVIPIVFFTVTNVKRKRLSVTIVLKLPVLMFGYLVQFLVDFLLFIFYLTLISVTQSAVEIFDDSRK